MSLLYFFMDFFGFTVETDVSIPIFLEDFYFLHWKYRYPFMVNIKVLKK